MRNLSTRFVVGAAAIALLAAACSGGEEAAAPAVETESVAVDGAVETSSNTFDEAVAAIEAAVDAAEASSGPGEPAIWSLSDEDTTVYLFGTIHLLRPETEWRTEAFDEAFGAADTLVLEVDATSPEAQAETARLMPALGLFTDGQTLTGVLNDEEEAIVAEAASKFGIQLNGVNQLKPWLVSLQLGLTQIQSEGYDPNSGLELILTNEAQASGKTFGYLETLEDQLQALGGAPIEDQVDGLIFTARTIESGAEMLDTLVSEWSDGDVDGLGVLIAEPAMMGSDAGYEALLVNRNRNWVPQIKAMLDEPGVKFVAVGAAHLAGPDSVVTMLRDEGLTVEGP
ncbi:MAG: TraB/GumN family protein [Pseudomonadota bacterium]